MLKFSWIDILNFAMCSARQLLDALMVRVLLFKHKLTDIGIDFSKEDFAVHFYVCVC